jgi:hypothetical protein
MSTPAVRDLASTVLNPDTPPAEFRSTALELAAQARSAPISVVTVSVRNVHGIDRVYPADNTAALFAALAGRKTFDSQHIQAIRALGFTVHVAARQLPEGF